MIEDAKYDVRKGDLTIETMPRHIKNVAAMYPKVTIQLSAKDALALARIIERGLIKLEAEAEPLPPRSKWEKPLAVTVVVACLAIFAWSLS